MLDPEMPRTVAAADDGKYFVDNASRVNTPPHSVYDRSGVQTLDLETTDISPLTDSGFKCREPSLPKPTTDSRISTV
jgi:hypothetical protein